MFLGAFVGQILCYATFCYYLFMRSYQILLLPVFLFLQGCSDIFGTSTNSEEWVIDSMVQLNFNPILTLSEKDNHLLVISGHNTVLIDSQLHTSKEYTELSTQTLNTRYRRPISSDLFVFSFSSDEESVVLNGFNPNSFPYTWHYTLNFRDADTLIYNGYSIYSPNQTYSIGAVSPDNYLAIALTQSSLNSIVDNSNYCYDNDVLIFSRIVADSSSYSVTHSYSNLYHYTSYGINSINFNAGYFYLATENGLVRYNKDGSDPHWFLHLDTPCSIYYLSTSGTDDSLYAIWQSSLRTAIIDIAFSGDSIFILDRSGKISLSSDNGNSWNAIFQLSSPNVRLVKTTDFFGVFSGSQIYSIDLSKGKLKAIPTDEISNLVINDIAQFKGKLFLATDGGLFSKSIKNVEDN